MILRPLQPESLDVTDAQHASEPAWVQVTRMQAIEAEQYLLVSQPDHARLSGELAAKFRASFLPTIDEATIKAIAAHDAGWSQFPFERDLQGDPPLTNNGRPLHFMQVPLQDSLSAWTGSIKTAGEISPLGDYMVSGHFSRIARMRIQMEVDTPQALSRLANFVAQEEEAQAKLEPRTGLDKRRLSEYVDLLQFCDVLSLYLCCGARQQGEFPQDFSGQRIRIRYDDGVYITEPSLFGEAQRFHVPVRIYPSKGGEGRTRIGFHII